MRVIALAFASPRSAHDALHAAVLVGEPEVANPLPVAAAVPSSLIGALVGTLVAGPVGLLVGGVLGGGAGALVARRLVKSPPRR